MVGNVVGNVQHHEVLHRALVVLELFLNDFLCTLGLLGTQLLNDRDAKLDRCVLIFPFIRISHNRLTYVCKK